MGFKAQLISPVWVTIEQVDIPETVMDDDAREPVKQASRKTEIRIRAQVSYSTTAGTMWYRGGQGGPTSDARGHLVFLKRKLTAGDGVNPYILRRGDRVTSIGGSVVVHYLDEVEDAAHNRGSSELEVWNFTDHAPSKQ